MAVSQTFLIVEPEFLIALDIQRVLEGLDTRQCVLSATPGEASDIVGDPADFALALLDFRSGDATMLTFARTLKARGIPLVLLASEIGLRHGVSELPGTPVVIKPFREDDLAKAVRAALAG